MSNHLTPLEVCERLIGPFSVIAEIVGYGPKSPYVWRKPAYGRGQRDPGDFPSAVIQRALLTHARAHNIPLTPEHLIFGAEAAEIEALAAQQQVAAE